VREIPRGQVAPSLLSSDFSRLAQQVELVMDADAKIVHFDVMDGKFVPPITIGSLVAESISGLIHERGGILDCHLMVERPEQYQVEMFAKAGADVITVHPEATPHIHYALQMIRSLDCRAGVVINPGTPIEAVEPVAEIIDLCLVMSVNPGWGGQRFIPTSTDRLARLRSMLPPEVVLEVDGGVSLETIDGVRNAGTDVFVAGSSVFGAEDPAEAFRALQARL
jgi:ribulose-phosphate 3-epimerase